jgi:hypothetical protein
MTFPEPNKDIYFIHHTQDFRMETIQISQSAALLNRSAYTAAELARKYTDEMSASAKPVYRTISYKYDNASLKARDALLIGQDGDRCSRMHKPTPPCVTTSPRLCRCIRT